MSRPARQLDVYDVLEEERVPKDPRDASRVDAARLCDWCQRPIPVGARTDAEVCGVVCRKRRWRFRKACGADSPLAARPSLRRPGDPGGKRPAAIAGPGRFAYADPPYPGKAGYYPEQTEVDHAALVARLEDGWPDGWALSTSAAALFEVLPLCPRSARVCVWRRRVRPTRSRRALSAWEPLVVVGGRELDTDAPQQLLDVLDYRGRYDSFPDALVGMKPPEFAVWMFAQLGARAGDELVDLFPGSGAITRAWDLYAADAPPGGRDASGQPGAGEPDASAAEVSSRTAASPELGIGR